MAAAAGGRDLMVRLVTSFDAIRVPANALAVPGSLNRAGLSHVVSHLLGDAEGAGRDFEFFVSSGEPGAGPAVSRPRRYRILPSFSRPVGLTPGEA